MPADYFPPASRGVIYPCIIASGVKTIVLIDGIFHSTRSVWQREILDAIGEGIELLGASSMGALRAAELHAFGMVGHGTIFEWYKNGLIEGDDEVALCHGPEELEFCALSEPLVNIRRTLQNAVADLCLTDDQALQLLDYSKRAYYPERSYSHLLTCPALESWPDRKIIEQYILTSAVDQKKLDAIGIWCCCANGQQARKTAAVRQEEAWSDIWRSERLRLTGFSCGSEIVLGVTSCPRPKKIQSFALACRPCCRRGLLLRIWPGENNYPFQTTCWNSTPSDGKNSRYYPHGRLAARQRPDVPVLSPASGAAFSRRLAG